MLGGYCHILLGEKMVHRCLHDWCYLNKRGVHQRTFKGAVQATQAVKVAKIVERGKGSLVSELFSQLSKLRKYGVN